MLHSIGEAVFVGQYEPAGHIVHVPSPANEYSPESQDVGASSVVGHLYPAGH